jgi:hypothetical protein
MTQNTHIFFLAGYITGKETYKNLIDEDLPSIVGYNIYYCNYNHTDLDDNKKLGSTNFDNILIEIKEKYIDFLKNKVKENDKVIIMGHSMGGLLGTYLFQMIMNSDFSSNLQKNKLIKVIPICPAFKSNTHLSEPTTTLLFYIMQLISKCRLGYLVKLPIGLVSKYLNNNNTKFQVSWVYPILFTSLLNNSQVFGHNPVFRHKRFLELMSFIRNMDKEMANMIHIVYADGDKYALKKGVEYFISDKTGNTNILSTEIICPYHEPFRCVPKDNSNYREDLRRSIKNIIEIDLNMIG